MSDHSKINMYEVEHVVHKNTDKFRKPAITFQKYGYYTPAPQGTSEYMDYWETERTRCLEGYTAEDGEYITGYHYFYLNYCPIWLVRDSEVTTKKGTRIVSERVREFPDFWDSDKQYYDSIEEAEVRGSHLGVIKARGKGYSFKGASMLNRNFFLIKGSKSYAIASEKEFLTKDGLLSKAWEMMDFINENTGWYKKRQVKNSDTHRRASYLVEVEGKKMERGYKSEIIGITLKNDVQKARGKRGKLILWEEAGKFPGLLEAWQIARPSVEQGGKAYGTMIAFGTGGTESGDYGSLKELFYAPEAYNLLPVRNIWDTGADDSACGFFIPQYMNLEGYMDDQGNSLVVKARKYCIEEREKVEKHANDPHSVDRYIAEMPFTPMEATLQLTGNIFPKKELAMQLAKIQTNKSLQNYKQVGELIFDSDGNLKWVQTTDVKDIIKYPLERGDDKKGSIVIWEHPPDEIPYGLYVAGCLTPGEKVLTDKGLKNVEEVKSGDKLINKEGDLVDIINFQIREKVDHDIFKFKMSNTYRTTTFTRGHPLYISKTGYNSNKTINENKFDFKFTRADQVKEGDWTKWPNVYRNKNNFDISTIWNKYKSTYKKIKNPLKEEDFWWFIGLWLGDGCCYNNRISISFNKSEVYYINKAKRIIENVINRSSQLYTKGENIVELSFDSKQLCSFLTDNFGKYAYGKYLAEWVKRIDIQYKYQLLWGYMASDGCITKHTKGYYSTEFVSVSLQLLEDIQDTLFSIDIVSGLSKMRSAKKATIQNRNILQKDTFHLRLSHHSTLDFIWGIATNSLEKPYYDHSIYEDPKVRRIDFKNLPKLRKKPKDGCFISEDKRYIYFQIKSIDHSLYTGDVYNFECETHNYISHHIAQKNCDPYDHDDSGTGSLGSTFIYKRFQNFEEYHDIIVAEYTGRPDTAEEYYENVRKLLMYYNARLLYENERKGLFAYFSIKGYDYLLAEQPDIISDIVSESKVRRRKGIHMVQSIKDWGEREIRDWLNEEYAPGKKNLTRILSVPLLQELLAYNDKGNFDRVMALMMVMIYKKELHNVHVKEKTETNKIDPFFTTDWFPLERRLNFNIR